MMDQVDVIIVNWNSGGQLEECVHSLLAVDIEQISRVIVVDNDSADASADFCEHLDRVVLVRSSHNLGFGAACNLGAAAAGAPFILLLNPDTRLIEPVIGSVLEFLGSPAGADYGVCGVQLIDERGAVTRHCARFPKVSTFVATSLGLTSILPALFPPLHLVEFDHETSRPVDHVMGAFYMIRRDLFRKLGGFDERFFVYLEDLDLSLRATQLGQGCFYLAHRKVFHRGGGTTRSVKTKSLLYVLQARLRYGRKHFTRLGNGVLVAATLFADPFTRTAVYLAQGSPRDARSALHAHILLWSDFFRCRFGGGAVKASPSARHSSR